MLLSLFLTFMTLFHSHKNRLLEKSSTKLLIQVIWMLFTDGRGSQKLYKSQYVTAFLPCFIRAKFHCIPRGILPHT